jgi:hypothetical protein
VFVEFVASEIGKRVKVPDLAGLALDDARTAVVAAGLRLSLARASPSTGAVLSLNLLFADRSLRRRPRRVAEPVRRKRRFPQAPSWASR